MSASPVHLAVINGGADPGAAGPLGTARRFLAQYRESGADGLHCLRGDYWRWNASSYEPVEEAAIRAHAYQYIESQGQTPNRRSVSDMIDALAGIAYLPPMNPPFALPDYAGPPPKELIICRNGAVHAPTRRLMKPDPRLFCTSALPMDYDPHAPAPRAWLEFLAELWPGDPDSIATLQEFMALAALTDDTTFQKLLLLIGPPRAGKGALFRLVGALAGTANICAPALSSLGIRFGLQSIIGCRLALISDVRIGRSVDAAAVAESLLRISGEDRVSIERKFAPDWQGRLPTRFMMAGNELPSLADASSALSSRLLVLRLTNTFIGREDHGLENRLLRELPGVLLWALDGLDRLRKRGHFVQPQSGNDLANALRAMNSPIGEFIEDKLVVCPDAWAEKSTLFTAWREWCTEHGRAGAGNDATFAKQLRASLPQVTEVRRRTESGGRLRTFAGVRIRHGGDPEPDDSGPGGPGGPSISLL